MRITTILFDLDGTLLPMDQEQFVGAYFGLLAGKVAPLGYEPRKLISSVWEGTKAMVQNDGSMTNEEAFWRYFSGVYGEKARAHKPVFDEFYRCEFQQARPSCGFAPEAAKLIARLRESGFRLVLATNPIFPAEATRSRIRWAGLNVNDFDLVTTYENSRFCKPNPQYYREILDTIGAEGPECLMIGNDTGEDMIAHTLGMKTFLLTDCLINRKNEDISGYPHGGYEALFAYLDEIGL